jgi:uroporphyrinogen decarboxylase
MSRTPMNSRERVLASIRHQEPDRVPIDLGATPSSGISAIAYYNLKHYLGITEGHTRVYDMAQQIAQPEDFILDRFGVDVVDVGRRFNTSAEDWYDFTLPQGMTVQYPARIKPVERPGNGWEVFAPDGTSVAFMPLGATFFDQTSFPYLDGYPADFRDLPAAMSYVHWSALAHSPWDHAGDADFWQQLRRQALALRRSTDRAIMIVAGCNLFEWGTFLRRLDNFLADLVLDQTDVERLLDALMEIHLATLERVCAAVGDVVDILRFGDDLGTDQGPFMAPATYRKLFKPRHTQLCEYVHKHSSMRTFLHSCGSLYKLLPDLIEAGYDVINPVQINTRDMEPERLKREFGRDITFWGGGVDTRHVLNGGSPREVKDQVKRLLDIWAPGGGYVFNTVHNILADVPPENVVGMYEAVAEFNGDR